MDTQSKGRRGKTYQRLYAGFHFSQYGYFYFKIYVKIIACDLNSVLEIKHIIGLLLGLTLNSVPASLS